MAGFDHEEIGSKSAQGAASNLLPAVLRRLSVIPGNHGKLVRGHIWITILTMSIDAVSDVSYDKVREHEVDTATAYEQTLSCSFLVSADMAHSVNPNYSHKYEIDHRPEMNKGTVIKVNANQKYSTNSPGIVLIQEVARRAKPSQDSVSSNGIPLQLFVVRNDSPCGGTMLVMLCHIIL